MGVVLIERREEEEGMTTCVVRDRAGDWGGGKGGWVRGMGVGERERRGGQRRFGHDD